MFRSNQKMTWNALGLDKFLPRRQEKRQIIADEQSLEGVSMESLRACVREKLPRYKGFFTCSEVGNLK